jgi:hypothetical protein
LGIYTGSKYPIFRSKIILKNLLGALVPGTTFKKNKKTKVVLGTKTGSSGKHKNESAVEI